MRPMTWTCLDYYCVNNDPIKVKVPDYCSNILLLDLSSARSHYGGQSTFRALKSRLLSRLQDIVAKDKTSDPQDRIDAILVEDAEGLSPKIWDLFSGFNPRHLVLSAGFEESCLYDPIRKMTAWNRLESLHLRNLCCMESSLTIPPFVLRTLTHLNLDHCLSLDLRVQGGCAPHLYLESLEIRANDIGYLTARLMRNFPSIKKSLRKIVIYDIKGGMDNERQRNWLRHFLQHCSGVKEVNLALCAYHAADIAKFIPATVQKLSFKGQRTMALLPLLDYWIACAKETSWAPQLQYLEFDFDTRYNLRPSTFFAPAVPGDRDRAAVLLEQGSEIDAATPTAGPVQVGGDDHEESDDDMDVDHIAFDVNPDSDSEASSVDEDLDTTDNGADSEESVAIPDLDNLPDIGPHPNHFGDPRMCTMKVGDKTITGTYEEVMEYEESQMRLGLIPRPPNVSEEAQEEFKRIFLEKKGQLFEALRVGRAGLELV